MHRHLFLSALASLVLGAPLAAQLDLPGKGSTSRRGDDRARGDLAPHLECTICDERDYTTRREPDSFGFQQVFCRVCRKVTKHKDSVANRRGGRDLELPSDLRRDGPGRAAPERAEPRPAAGPGAPATPLELTDSGRAAGFVFDEIARVDDPDDGLVRKAVESLINFGEAGRMAARLQVTSDHGPTILTAARVLLASGQAADAEAVVRRVRGRVPNRVCRPLVKAVVEADPVHGSPAFLCRLLDHRQGSMRAVAEELLEDALSPEVLPRLEEVLQSQRSDARARAVRLIERLDDPEAVDVLLAHVGDPTASVAWEITDALASSADPRVDGELLGIAFHERWILRREAYALLTIVEREDRRLEPILDGSHVEPLLAALESRDPFVSGTAAAALAGLGFRSPRPGESRWLDREVPDRLVYAISGREFHNDYSSLQRPVLRRLRRVTGETLGTDGPAWATWWVSARDAFQARRAWIECRPEDAPRLALRFKRDGFEAALFTLAGPLADPYATESPDGESGGPGEVVRISEAEAGDLMRLCEREGVFGPERLPGVRGTRGPGERTIDVRVGEQGKRFVCGSHAGEPWFERVATMAEELRERNRWQRYVPVAADADEVARGQALAEEGTFWSAPHEPLERSRRLKELVLGWLPGQLLSDRDAAVAELARLSAEPGVLDRDDFGPLVELLDAERFLAERARQLLGLALRAARGDAMELGREDAFELVRILHDRFGPAGARELASVFEAAGRELTREMAGSERALMRAVAAAALADDPDEEDVRTLLELLGDDDATVEIAAVVALGQERIEAARTELLVRARAGRPEVRKAALRAAGKLGGEYVMEALLLALAGEDPGLRNAAAEGLADLRDPRATSYLIQFLGEPRGTPLHEAGRRGLAQLGEVARGDLLGVLHTPEHPGREAAALLLSEQGVPQAVPALIRLLSDDEHGHVARELCVLTCVDLREREEPARAWWDWWDSVLHDDALAWFRAALERLELDPPPAEAFRAGAERDTARYLLGLFERDEAWLVERARRELERVLGRSIPMPPPPGPDRRRWLSIASSWLDQGAEQDLDR